MTVQGKMGFARRMAPQAPRKSTPTSAYYHQTRHRCALVRSAEPISYHVISAKFSVIPAKAGIYASKGLDPRLRGNDGAGERWALPGEWRRRRPGKVHQRQRTTTKPAIATRWFVRQ